MTTTALPLAAAGATPAPAWLSDPPAPVPALPPGTDLAEVPLPRLADELTTYAAHLAAAEARFCEVLAVFDEREGWAAVGVLSCAHWLAWRCGLSPGAAREKVRVARALTDLPSVRRAFAAGRLSYSQVRAITRVATPEDEEQLVQWALHCPASQLERLLAGVRTVRGQQAEDRAQEARSRREVHWHWADDGSLVLSARLPAEQGARLVAAVEALARQMLRDEAGETETQEGATRPDLPAGAGDDGPAVGAAPDADASSGTETGPGLRTPPAAARGRAAGEQDHAFLTGREADEPPVDPRTHDGLAARLRGRGGWDALCADALSHLAERSCSVSVEVAVDAAVLDDPAADGTCGLVDGPALAASTVERLLCGAAVRPVVTGDLLHQGRTSRAPNRAQRRALWRRDGGCAFPGCGARLFVDAHHVVLWHHGGLTDVENLVLLCRRHHVAVHEGGFRFEMPVPGHVRVHDPSGDLVPVVPARPAGDARRLADSVPHARGLPPDALEPQWYGDRLDLDLALLCLPRPADVR